MSVRTLTVSHIALPVDASDQEAFSVARRRLLRERLLPDDACFSLYRRSVDARRKKEIRLVYTVAVRGEVSDAQQQRLAQHPDIALLPEGFVEPEPGTQPLTARPVIVGTGPCGLFAGLLLAERGYAPILLERGGTVEERQRAVHALHTALSLDPDTNIQFGAGGAGTFSDGKLVTRVHDPLTHYVLERFVEFGAPREILLLARPHIGTDILSQVVEAMLTRICELGGEVRYHTRLQDVRFADGAGGRRVVAAVTAEETIPCDALLLAIGHSARDTYTMLCRAGLPLVAKDFSVGMRIEHLTADIDRAMYGDLAGHPALGHAEYTLSHNTKVRGVYTFCMCPGGEVVAATSEEGGVVTNGMSRHRRDGVNSNAAVVCSVFRGDYGDTPLGAIAFQQQIERAAFRAGGGDYAAPILTVGDLLAGGRPHTAPSRIHPTYMEGRHVRLAAAEDYLPPFVTGAIRDALPAFDRRIAGFADPAAVLTGAETRTSAPVRILRDPETRQALGCEGLYPAGEGAGYAGGITSAALDGIRTACAVISRYCPPLVVR